MKSSRAIWLCNGGMLCIAFVGSLIPVYLTTFGETFGGLSKHELGQIPATMFIGAFVGILLSGPLADRLGAKRFAVGGMGLCVAGLLCISQAPTYSVLLIASGILGLGAGVLDMILSPIVSALSTENRVAAMNRLHAFYCLGVVGIVLVTSLCIHFNIPWRWVIALLALMPLTLGIGFLTTPLPPLVHPDHERYGLRRLLRRPRFYAAMAMILCVGAIEEGMGQWLPAYIESVLGYSKTTGGMALAGFALLMGVGRLTSPMVIQRFGVYATMLCSAMGCTLFYIIASQASTPMIAFSACILVGLMASILWPTTLGMTADRIPQGGATMFSFMAGVGNVGCIIAPWGEGIIADTYGLRTAIGLGALSPFLLILIVIGVWISDTKRPSDESIRA